jgi:hypothetical protein
LKTLLEHLPILVIGGVFNGDGVITLADFATFLCFPLPLVWYIFKLREGSWIGGVLGDVILQTTTWVSATTPGQSVLISVIVPTHLVRRMRRVVLWDRARSVRRHVLEYLAYPLDNIVIVDFALGILDESSSPVY